jgi:L-lactate dehydrogenase complex protein LldG
MNGNMTMGGDGKPGDRAAALAALQARRPVPPIGDDLLEDFTSKLQSQAGITHEIASLDEVPQYIVDHIISPEGREPILAHGADPLLLGIHWGAHGDFELVGAESIRHGGVALSTAIAAVAETGSLVLCSAPENPTLLNFLPDHHVVIIREKDIVGSFEDMWSHLRKSYKEGFPRAINVISGPSSTADVAVTFVFGVHGPTRLHALVLSD